MTPIDDELRAAMHARADVLTPSPDPLAGIESTARGMRRRRVAATVAGAALAVSAVAVAVPSLTSGGTTRTPNQLASPNQSLSTSDAYLDPAHPWAFRGRISDGSRDAFQREWQVKHPGSTMTLLFGQTYEPSGQEEALFVASGPDGDRRGFVRGTESGPELFEDETYGTPRGAVSVELPGDEGVDRLIVVAAPDSTISATGATFTELAPGVGVAAVEKHVHWVVKDSSGKEVAQGDAEPASYDRSPTNLVDWPSRGLQDSSLLEPARAMLAPTLPGDGEVLLYVLFTGDTDSGVKYVVGQAYRRGDALAHTFWYAEGLEGGPASFLGPTDAGDVFAFVLGQLPGTTTDLLVVVPRPQTGQVLYDDDATGSFTPVTGQDQLDGVVTIDRSTKADSDRLQLLDGDGVTYFEGLVRPLLCGSKECG